MLIICKECGMQVSTLAPACPHCGCPANINTKNTPAQPESTPQQPQPKKRMHLPNGFGSISEIHSRNLRNPFYVKVPAGKTPEGRPISKPLKPQAYFKTYNEAYQALTEYHRNPYDPATDITMQELYDMWYKEKEKTVDHKTMVRYASLWKYSDTIKSMSVREMRVHHLKDCINNGTRVYRNKTEQISPISAGKLKFLYNQLFDYAVENEYVDKNIARLFSVRSEYPVKKEHIPFTAEEVAILWQNINTCDPADLLLIQCYMGWRPQELCELRMANVNLEQGWISGGMKTKSGKNRQVPIHPKVMPLIEARYAKAKTIGSEYLFNHNYERWKDKWVPYTYYYYSDAFVYTFPTLGINPEHRGHDGRVHFVTMAKEYNMDEYAIKRIVGHQIKDLTERVYTKRTIEWLASEIRKIP
jgi:integrase